MLLKKMLATVIMMLVIEKEAFENLTGSTEDNFVRPEKRSTTTILSDQGDI